MKSDLELSGIIDLRWLVTCWNSLHVKPAWMSKEYAYGVINGAHLLCGDDKVSSDLSLLADIAYVYYSEVAE